VNAKAGYTLLQERPSFDVDDFGTFHFGAGDNWTTSIGVEYPLYTGGKLEGMRDASRAGLRGAEHDHERQRQLAALTAARAYFRALEARRMIGVLEEQIEALQEALRTGQAMYDQGVAAKIDVLRPQAALGGARNGLSQVRAGYQTALAALAETMGLPPGTLVDIVEREADRATPELAPEQWEAAWEARPELQALQAKRKAAAAQVRVARSDKRPQVGLFVLSEVVRPTYFPETGHFSGGVMVQQSVSDGGATRAAVREARHRLSQLDAADEQLRNGIAVQVQAAINETGSARARVDTTEESLAVAREALRLAQIGYQNGVTPMLDLLSAQAAMTRANADHEGALSALRQAFAEYDAAMGRIVGRAQGDARGG
jgi:outer membrane protein TolC